MNLKRFLSEIAQNGQRSHSVELYSPEDHLAIFGNALFGTFHGELTLPAQLSSMWRHINEQSSVIKTVLLLNTVFFVLWHILPAWMERHAAVGNMNWKHSRWWSILLSAFSHRDLAHFMGNMSIFLTIGSLVQKEVGNMLLVSIVILSAVVSGGCTLIYRHLLAVMFPNINRFQNTLYATTIGFSGVVSALVCLYTHIHPSLQLRYMHVNRYTTLYDLYTYLLWFDVFGLAVSTLLFSTGISHTSHLGGVITGLLIRRALIATGTSGQIVQKKTVQLLSRELLRPVEALPISRRLVSSFRHIVAAPVRWAKGNKVSPQLSRCWL